MKPIIKDIQLKLQANNYYQGYLDGLYGRLTQEAISSAVRSGDYRLYFNFQKFKDTFKKPSLTQSFVDSINSLFDTFNAYDDLGATNPLNIAYLLATAWHETAYTMLPIKEYGSYQYLSKYDTGRLARILGNTPQADGDGQLYAGRGYVMITGKANYSKFSKILGIDLVNNPDLAMNPEIAAKILVIGCLRGSFTGRKLSDYIRNGSRLDFIRARAVVNGVDKSEAIANHAERFLECIQLNKIN